MDKALSFLSNIVIFFYRALITMYFFNWFISDTFSFSNVTYVQALGLTLFVGILKSVTIDESSYHYKQKNIDAEDSNLFGLTRSIATILAMTFMLLIGFIVKLTL